MSYALVARNQHDIDVNAPYEGRRAGETIIDVTSWSRINAPKVPSVISYAPSEGHEAQWGYEISNAGVQMMWTKLQLNEQKRLDELDLLWKALEGMADLGLEEIQRSRGLPAYPAKEPVDVVTDYLSLLRAHFVETDLEGDRATIGRPTLRRAPIDLVLTCPSVRTARIWRLASMLTNLPGVVRCG